MNGDAETTGDGLVDGFLCLWALLFAPAFDEIQDGIGALVSAFGAARPRLQTRQALILERALGGVESLATDAECSGHLRDRPTVDTVAPQHLVLDLQPVAAVEELAARAERFVAHGLGMGMEGPRGAQGGDFRVLGLRFRASGHECQYYYIHDTRRLKRYDR